MRRALIALVLAAVITGGLILWFSIVEVSRQAPGSPSLKSNVFQGRFLPEETFVRVNEEAKLAFVVSPIVDSDVQVRLRLPLGFIELVEGNSSSAGQVKAGESIQLFYTIRALEEGDVSLSTEVTGVIHSSPLTEAYYHRVRSFR